MHLLFEFTQLRKLYLSTQHFNVPIFQRQIALYFKDITNMQKVEKSDENAKVNQLIEISNDIEI